MDALFDKQVAEITRRGVEARDAGKRKRDCTPEEWAAYLKYNREVRPRSLEKAREYRKRNSARYKELYRSRNLWKNFHLTVPQYEAMLAGQEGVCAICGGGCATGMRLAVDHQHDTGIVRGLLCFHCNSAAGKMQDSPELLRKLADYIEQGGTQAFCLKTFYQRATETTNARN